MNYSIRALAGLWLCTLSSPALAGITIGLSGSTSENHLGLESAKNQGISANINLDLSEYFRVGLTHRRSTDSGFGRKRLKDNAGNEAFVAFQSTSVTVTNSLDLIVVLYNGVVSPYVFGGVAEKSFYSITTCESGCSVEPLSGKLFPVPNYGFGVGFYLSREFSIKISQTYSPGVTTKTEDGIPVIDPDTGKEEARYVQDSYTQIGINYRL